MDNMPSPGFEVPGERSTDAHLLLQKEQQSDEIKSESGIQYMSKNNHMPDDLGRQEQKG